MATHTIRNGRGHRAYRRAQQTLANKYKQLGLPCPTCGKPFDWEHPQSARGFTADHPIAIANGGPLTGQKLTAMCRECNARKGATVTPVIRDATPPPS